MTDDFLAIFSGRGYDATTPGFTASTGRLSFHAAETFTNATQGTYVAFETTALGTNFTAERVRISPEGNVGIGTTTPIARLDVNGNINVSGNINAKYQDVAEWVTVNEPLEPATVVVLDPEKSNQVMPSTHGYDTTVAGVVSRRPGIVLGEGGTGKETIATTGRVRVRVDATRLPIRVGDLLVTSDIRGVAMRSEPITISGRSFHQPGTIIGKALEPLASGTGEVLVLLTLQ